MSSVCSMTGFANAQTPCPLGTIAVELRCVNSRFLDLTLRIPDELRCAEPLVRELIARRVPRGKLECRISLQRSLETTASAINTKALDALLALQHDLRQRTPEASPLQIVDILNFPGIVASNSVDAEALNTAVTTVLNGALDTFAASRAREGSALATVLLGYCDQIVHVVDAVGERIPDIIGAMRTKLMDRLDSALSQALTANSVLTKEEISERIRQEVTLYALRIDVDEEMNRLKTHVTEVRRILKNGGAIGRRLDFLMQEMNREANTLGSKAAAIEMTNASLELKLAIEQMREQIQNIE